MDYAAAYFAAVWKALVAALLIAAAIEAFLPRRWLLSVLSSGPRRLRDTFASGSISMLSMMCTCCTSPVAVSLRRQCVPMPAALAFWLGNPTLNPAVLAFMATGPCWSPCRRSACRRW